VAVASASTSAGALRTVYSIFVATIVAPEISTSTFTKLPAARSAAEPFTYCVLEVVKMVWPPSTNEPGATASTDPVRLPLTFPERLWFTTSTSEACSTPFTGVGPFTTTVRPSTRPPGGTSFSIATV
jgi:hypothetical protein